MPWVKHIDVWFQWASIWQRTCVIINAHRRFYLFVNSSDCCDVQSNLQRWLLDLHFMLFVHNCVAFMDFYQHIKIIEIIWRSDESSSVFPLFTFWAMRSSPSCLTAIGAFAGHVITRLIVFTRSTNIDTLVAEHPGGTHWENTKLIGLIWIIDYPLQLLHRRSVNYFYYHGVHLKNCYQQFVGKWPWLSMVNNNFEMWELTLVTKG